MNSPFCKGGFGGIIRFSQFVHAGRQGFRHLILILNKVKTL
jgi:hypothetical protein